MSKKCGWDLLEAGELRGALQLFKEEHANNPEKPTANNLGLAYLCLGDALNAQKYFDEAMAELPSDTGTHACAGIARWILAQRSEAVRIWNDGLDAEFRDEAGGLELPMLLFYAGARDSRAYTVARAKKLIAKVLEGPLAANWPGPLGRLILGEIGEDRARENARSDMAEATGTHLSQIEFYIGLQAYLGGDKRRFSQRMRRCADMCRCDFNNEWLLARYEIGYYTKPGPR